MASYSFVHLNILNDITFSAKAVGKSLPLAGFVKTLLPSVASAKPWWPCLRTCDIAFSVGTLLPGS